MRTSELDYELPPDRIAAVPAEPRDAARLMVVDRAAQTIAHHHVRDLPDLGLVMAGDLLVVNETRVLPAFLTMTRAKTGGRVTGLYLTRGGEASTWIVMLESRGKLQPGEAMTFAGGQTMELVRSLGAGQWEVTTAAKLEDVGATPLPPYIRKLRQKQSPAPEDAQRYNTVYAKASGSVAAPTAGLHFTPGLLARLDDMGVRRAAVTLHVGVGTFRPIRAASVRSHVMHSEPAFVGRDTLRLLRDTRAGGGRIIPVGTTTIRAMESLPEDWESLDGDFAADTDLFIHPESTDFRGFRFADAVMTNFHLPRSTLLAMIATLPGVGLERLLSWYGAAVEAEYRFYSYGDAMWVK